MGTVPLFGTRAPLQLDDEALVEPAWQLDDPRHQARGERGHGFNQLCVMTLQYDI